MSVADYALRTDALFMRNAIRWKYIADRVESISRQLPSKLISDDGSGPGSTMRSGVGKLREAVDRLVAAAERPEVVISTFGTDSCGKSAVVNMLVGDILIPCTSADLRAGDIVVHHSDVLRTIVIDETRGATWDTGIWDYSDPGAVLIRRELGVRRRSEEGQISCWAEFSSREIHERIALVMREYREAVESEGKRARARLEPPRIHVYWPTSIGVRSSEFGLPRGASLSIADGGPHRNEGEGGVGGDRELARRSLWIGVYSVTDSDLENCQGLVEHVVNRAKALRVSPAQMLLVLNGVRSSVLDSDLSGGLVRSIDAIGARIQELFRAEAYESAIDGTIRTVPLTGELCVYWMAANRLISSGDNEQFAALYNKICDACSDLVVGDNALNLGESVVDWTVDRRSGFAQLLLSRCGFVEFESSVAEHIGANLPEAILPGLVVDAHTAAQQALAAIVDIMGPNNVQTAKVMKDTKAEIEKLDRLVRGFEEKRSTVHRAIREMIGERGDITGIVCEALTHDENQIRYGKPWFAEVFRLAAHLTAAQSRSVDGPLKLLHSYVVDGVAGRSVLTPYDRVGAVRLLDASHALLKSPYGPVAWKKGGTFYGDDAVKVRNALQYFANEVSAASKRLVNLESYISADMMRHEFREVLKTTVDAIRDDNDRLFLLIGSKLLEQAFRFEFDMPAAPMARVCAWADDRVDWGSIVPSPRRERRLNEDPEWWLFENLEKTEDSDEDPPALESHDSAADAADEGADAEVAAVGSASAESEVVAPAAAATGPVESVAVESAPVESVAVESVAVESAPVESVAVESVAVESVAVESVVVESAPEASAAEAGAPVESAPEASAAEAGA
ncbi:MAG: hypothetical protein FWD57_04050, partial [Polyangiaceae bacterium]|nr:hypothetical protein [Polyangiaceae bacterium]